MDNKGRPRLDFMRDLGQAVDQSLNTAKDKADARLDAAARWATGRSLTTGEINMIQWMFGAVAGIAGAKVYPRNYWWPLPNNRVMTPSGDIFYPRAKFYDDFSLPHVPVPDRALFMHEATHLYQWYVLRQWVAARGLVDREYDYELVPGQSLKGYRVEQMGQMVEDYYNLRHGYLKKKGRRIRLQDFSHTLPIRAR